MIAKRAIVKSFLEAAKEVGIEIDPKIVEENLGLSSREVLKKATVHLFRSFVYQIISFYTCYGRFITVYYPPSPPYGSREVSVIPRAIGELGFIKDS